MKRFRKLLRHTRGLKRQGLIRGNPYILALKWWWRGDDFVLPPDPKKKVYCRECGAGIIHNDGCICNASDDGSKRQCLKP